MNLFWWVLMLVGLVASVIGYFLLAISGQHSKTEENEIRPKRTKQDPNL